MTDQLMDDLSNEEHEALLLMSEHAIAPPLSPAAQVVLDAALQYKINPECCSRMIATEVLRALAYCSQVKAEFFGGNEYVSTTTLIAIARELEGL